MALPDLYEKIHFDCVCDSDEHVFVVRMDREEGEMYTSVHLNGYLPWYKRAWYALRYVFGYHCRYGHWDCVLLDEVRATKLRDTCDKALVVMKQHREQEKVARN